MSEVFEQAEPRGVDGPVVGDKAEGKTFTQLHWADIRTWTSQKIAKELRDKFGLIVEAGSQHRSTNMSELIRQYELVNPISGVPNEMKEMSDVEVKAPMPGKEGYNPLNPYPGKTPGTEIFYDMVIHAAANEPRFQFFANQSANMEYLVERGKRVRLPKLLVKTCIDDAIEEIGEARRDGPEQGEPVFRAVPRFSYTIYNELEVPIKQTFRLKPEKLHRSKKESA